MRSMFCLIIVIIATAIILAVEPQQEMISKIIETSNKCVNKTGVSISEIMQLSMMKTPDSDKPFCYLACTAKSLEFMTPDNKINMAKVNSTLALFKDELTKTDMFEKVIKLINTCMPAVAAGGSNECDVAKAGFECIVKNGKEDDIFNHFK